MSSDHIRQGLPIRTDNGEIPPTKKSRKKSGHSNFLRWQWGRYYQTIQILKIFRSLTGMGISHNLLRCHFFTHFRSDSGSQMSQIPIGWLINRGVCFTPLTIGNWFDRWYTSHRPKAIFTKRTQINCSGCIEVDGRRPILGCPWRMHHRQKLRSTSGTCDIVSCLGSSQIFIGWETIIP